MRSLGEIELAYIGAHEIIQLAAAAEQLGSLGRLQYSLFDAPGKWGRKISRWTNVPSGFPTGAELIPAFKVREIPLPLVARTLAQKLFGKQIDPLLYHRWFELCAACAMKHSTAALAVSSETSALHYFKAAKAKGMKCLLDSHGIPAPFLDTALRRCAEEFSLPVPKSSDSPAMISHKQQERELADVILFCSDLQMRLWIELGVPEKKCHAIPLWVDSEFWRPAPSFRPSGTLRLATVGSGSIGKGLPYLLRALQLVDAPVEASLVGNVAPELNPMLSACRKPIRRLPYMNRDSLRSFLQQQDLLIMPSLGDSFGFIAMEAMACGLPVIVTSHCGVPVPVEHWRVPAFDPSSIADRISSYASESSRLTEDSRTARDFALQYSPQRYRDKAKQLFLELLK